MHTITELLFISGNSGLCAGCAGISDVRIRNLSDTFDMNNVSSFLAEAGKTSLVILDMKAADRNFSAHTIDLCREQGIHVITYSDKVDNDLKKFLLQKGIADIYNERSFQYFSSYVSLLRDQRTSGTAGSILILDDDPCVTAILRSILHRFHYTTVITPTLHDFFEELPRITPALILMGLSTKKFDIQAFVKTAHGDSSLKRAPFIAYKKPDDGIFIHELISGIRRYTKVILSPEELYSLLIHIAFRREIAPYIGSLSTSLDFSEFSMLTGAPLSQMYYNLGVDLCSAEYIFSEEKISQIHTIIDNISAAIVKAESIKWLTGDNETRATCATYV